MDFIELPSGRILNLGVVIEVTLMDAETLQGDHRSAVGVIIDASGGGRVFYDDDADVILAAVRERNPIAAANDRLKRKLEAANAAHAILNGDDE